MRGGGRAAGGAPSSEKPNERQKGKKGLTTLVPQEGSLGFFPSKGPP